ncbi:MAG TPA: CRTAC1 family protein [Blastocatellia bacterium]|nr:CRTAC1 family protein [Blastocatellia bacterium]
MSPQKKLPDRKQNFPVLFAVFGVAGLLGALARVPSAPSGEVAHLASRFRFATQTLPRAPMPPGGVVFPVNRTCAHMQLYFYEVGGSAALGDLDGDGLPNDLVRTDIRSKAVVVSPAPGTGNRYAPFVLDFGKFFDRVTEYPTLVRIADMNEDGLEDIFVGFYGRPPLLLLRRAPADLKPQAPLSMDSFSVEELVPGLNQRWWTATATFADLDGDGHQDIFVGNYYPDGAELTDGTSTKPFEMNEDFSRARNGGTSRIFLYSGSRSGPNPAVSYRDAGNVLPNTSSRAWTLAVGAADLDRDGLSDLYIANDFGPDELLWNRSKPGAVKFQELHGQKSFFRAASTVIGQDSFKGMGIDFADINNDGIFDMYVSNIASPFALQESHFLWVSTGQMDRMTQGVAPWLDRADELGVAHSAWAWDAKFEDFDNAGTVEIVQATGLVKGTKNRWPDLAQVGAGNDLFVKYQSAWPTFLEGSDVDGTKLKPFWVLGSDGRYVDLSPVLFPDLTQAMRGIAIGDVDGDGYPDMVYAALWEDSVFVKNLASGNRFLGLHLLLPVAPPAGGAIASSLPRVHDGHPTWREGTPAIGSFVEIEMPDGRRQIRQVDGGNGHSGQRSPEVLFGLGKTSAAELPVHITWRDLNGALHHNTFSLAPGYHTIVLGGQ